MSRILLIDPADLVGLYSQLDRIQRRNLLIDLQPSHPQSNRSMVHIIWVSDLLYCAEELPCGFELMQDSLPSRYSLLSFSLCNIAVREEKGGKDMIAR